MVTISKTLLDTWESTINHAVSGREPLLIVGGDTLDKVVALTEMYIEDRHPESMGLVRRESTWRNEAPTKRQLDRLRRHKLVPPDDLRRGDASRLIAMLLKP
jgi:hypothetical protein